MGGDNLMLIGQATIGAVVEKRARARANVLALMALSTWALANEVVAMFTKIIAPRVRVVARCTLVEGQRPPIHITRIRLILFARVANRAAGKVAIAPVIERLGIREVGGVF